MKIIRLALRWFCITIPIRGRHRLANVVGKWLAPSYEEILRIGGIHLPIDHSIEMYRYIFYGVYEEEFVNLIKRIVKKGDTIIEPGTNVGYITSVLSSIVGEGMIYSLEPSKICYKKIEKYLTQPNIKLMNAAIADIDGQLNFIDKEIVIAEGYSAFSKFAGKKTNDNEYLIPTITVDTLISQNNLENIKLLKLDVEGAELMALRGAKNALLNKKIEYLLVETAFVDSNKIINDEIYKLLKSYGYDCYLMTHNNLKSFDYYSENNSRYDVIWTYTKQ